MSQTRSHEGSSANRSHSRSHNRSHNSNGSSRQNRPANTERPNGARANNSRSNRNGQTSSAQQRRDTPRAIFPTPAAEELLELIDDNEGDADEDMLNLALDAVLNPRVVDNASHARRKRGELVALAFSKAEADAIERLIEDDELPEPALRAKIRERLDQSIQEARQRLH